MRITAVIPQRVSIPLHEPFVISLGAIDAVDTVLVRIETDEGLVGIGEGSAVGFVTGETTDTVLGAIDQFTPMLLGLNPYAIEHIHHQMDRILVRNGSAKAAIDIACYDLMAQAAGLPLYQFLGGTSGEVRIDQTIGLGPPDVMARQAASIVAAGYTEIKIKAGSDEELDRKAIGLISAAAPGARLKVDANQGWTVPTAMSMLGIYAVYGVSLVEQPLPHWDIEGMAYLRSHSPIPIMADESCFTEHDASVIVRRNAADLINIKLMKCGGIYRGLQINTIAEAAGIECMVGCMLESRVAIAAGAHLVASRANIRHADLDSFTDFDDSSVVSSAFGFVPPVIYLSDEPGIGVKLKV
ncbi:MAG: dipeptide epimerase [Propionibacteriaceae bacterium]|nr:dipeptide epimerase [Propionibacteriaceae bacterium]